MVSEHILNAYDDISAQTDQFIIQLINLIYKMTDIIVMQSKCHALKTCCHNNMMVNIVHYIIKNGIHSHIVPTTGQGIFTRPQVNANDHISINDVDTIKLV